MRLRLATAVAIAVTTALTPSAANATGTGYFDPVPTVTMLDGCIYVPFTVHLSLVNTSAWSLETRVLYPDGTLFDLGLASGGPSDVVVGEEQMVFCHPKDPPGIYTIQGTLNTDDVDATHHTVSLPPIAFEVVAPPPPPPPPPPLPIKDVEGKAPVVSKMPHLGEFTVAFKTKSTPAGYQVGDKYTWKVLINGQKVKTFEQGAAKTRLWRTNKLPVGELQKIVIKGNGEVRYKGKMTPK